MCFSTFIVKKKKKETLRPCFNSCVLSGSVLGGGRDHRKGIGGEMMQGDLNSPRAPTQSNPHTQSLMHAYNSSIRTHIIYAGEKYINICITKQYKGLSVVKYLLSLKSTGVVISLCLLYAKLSLSLPSTKYLLSSMKNIPIIQRDLRHWIRFLYMKSLFTPLPQSLFCKWKPPPESYMIWMPL